jgi:hypothetical protein
MPSNFKASNNNSKKSLKASKLSTGATNPTTVGYVGGSNPSLPASTVDYTSVFFGFC